MPRFRAFLALILVSAQLACSNRIPLPPAGPPPPVRCETTAALTHTIYLIGDAGAVEIARDDSPALVDPVLRALRARVDTSVAALGADSVAVFFLGDNVYQYGLVPVGEKDRRRGERVLEAQIEAAGAGRAYFLAGNHDWDQQGARGWDHVVAQRDFLATKGPRVAMLPPGGCSGPSRVDFGDHLRFVLIDPIGFDHLLRHPDVHKTRCPDELNRDEQYLDLVDAFDRTDDRHIVLGVHHPLITAGPHGGNFTWRHHLFPLTDFVDWAWLPLPVIGSLYPISRRLGVTGTDVDSRQYANYIIGIYQAWTPRGPMLVAAGHEHSLQVHRDVLGMFYAVSGAGSAKKVNRVEKLDTALMAAAEPGFMRLDVLSDGTMSLETLAVDDDARTESIYQACLAEGPPQPVTRSRQAGTP